jgi:uncharacterized protein YbjT (DUF2867 family)
VAHNIIRRRVLVAGATGYLGGYVAKELKSRGHFVRALARSPSKLDYMKDEIDEIVQGEITIPQTIENVCEGIDVVFSSVGITKQKGRATFTDVDYQGNRNLLEIALNLGVKKFIYVSVFNGRSLRRLAIVKAHEDYVDVLRDSGIAYSIIRPTGYFSDLGMLLDMARKGRVYLIGSGHNKVNPIHGADLAVTCVDAMDSTNREIDVGGPQILSYRQIAELALEAQGKPARITSVPMWVLRLAIGATRVFSRHQADLLDFFTTASTIEFVAPPTGSHTLREYYAMLARGSNAQASAGQYAV